MISRMNQQKPGRFRFLHAALLSALLLSGCAADEVTGHLERTILAVQIALPTVLASSGVDAGTIDTIQRYLATVSAAAATSADILTDPAQTPAQRGASIALVFSQAIAPELPPGTPTAVNVALQSVAAAVRAFLSQVRTTSAEIRLSHPALVMSFEKTKKHRADKKRLEALKRKAEQVQREIEATRKKS